MNMVVVTKSDTYTLHPDFFEQSGHKRRTMEGLSLYVWVIIQKNYQSRKHTSQCSASG